MESVDARVPIEELTETPTRDDLPSRTRLPEVAPVAQDALAASTPDAGSVTPKIAPELEAPPSSQPPLVPKPPPLPESAPRLPAPASAAPNAARATTASAGTPVRPKPGGRPVGALPAGARYARMVALAFGAGLATVWISSRARHTDEPADSVPPAQSAAVNAALQQAQALAKSCDPNGMPARVTELTVTFAPNGKVASAELEGESTSESVRACILSHVHTLEIPAFEGSAIQVRREIALGP